MSQHNLSGFGRAHNELKREIMSFLQDIGIPSISNELAYGTLVQNVRWRFPATTVECISDDEILQIAQSLAPAGTWLDIILGGMGKQLICFYLEQQHLVEQVRRRLPGITSYHLSDQTILQHARLQIEAEPPQEILGQADEGWLNDGLTGMHSLSVSTLSVSTDAALDNDASANSDGVTLHQIAAAAAYMVEVANDHASVVNYDPIHYPLGLNPVDTVVSASSTVQHQGSPE